MSLSKGWIEKRQGERVLMIQEALFHRVLIKKIPRQKDSKVRIPARQSDEAYYVLDKKVHLGDYALIGNLVLSKNDILVVQMRLPQFMMNLRLLGKITKGSTLVEHKRVYFQGDLHFLAVHKGDFDMLLAWDDRRKKARGPVRNQNPVAK